MLDFSNTRNKTDMQEGTRKLLELLKDFENLNSAVS